MSDKLYPFFFFFFFYKFISTAGACNYSACSVVLSVGTALFWLQMQRGRLALRTFDFSFIFY